MDWYLDSTATDAPARLKAELRDFCRRHASPDSDVEAAILVAWELMTNVVRHAQGPMWVSLDWTEIQPRLDVHDLGPGFELGEALEKEPGPDGGFGLKLVSAQAEELRAVAKKAGGSRVSTILPLFRPSEADRAYDEAEPPSGVSLAQLANSEGWIDRESFLMGVAVDLAQGIALEYGPEAAAKAINRVGRQVGSEMEAAYRAARGIEGPLTTEQLGELLVGLKSAIGGDFWIENMDEEQIVLGNGCCPFGADAVQRAPALCQMTSAVFGGIAAHNRSYGRVVLEERIAVGDPGCRVVVHLSPADQKDRGRRPSGGG